MANSSSDTQRQTLLRASKALEDMLSRIPYTPSESAASVSIKAELQSLLPSPDVLDPKIRDFALCCAALASATEATAKPLSWIPESLSIYSVSALEEFSETRYDNKDCNVIQIGGEELDLRGLKSENKLVIELMPEVIPVLKGKIKESAIDTNDESDGFSASSARVPVAHAIVAAYQFRWFVTQVDSPYLGKLCHLLIPCALTALDHWSPEVKGQGMISFIHFVKNLNAGEIGGFADVILDACCQNVACEDDIWHYQVEMSVRLITLTKQSNPRNPWFEKLFSEMLNHLERQPSHQHRRVAWLTHVEPMFNALGLILLAHFRRLFPLFFKWMHADDDDTVLLVLVRITTILRLTWIRNTPYIERLVDELVSLYKDAALKVAREDIRSHVLKILTIIQLSKSSQFDTTWAKYKDDPNLIGLHSSLTENNRAMVP